MSTNSNALGDFLRARRGLVSPAQAGVVDDGTRRVPGLRREEVALLAGVSADYYLRLERGRDRNPSVQVLESIGRVLQLDDDHLAYLVALAGTTSRPRRRRPPKETVSPGMLAFVQSLPHPAYIEGRYFDILAANPVAAALSPRLVVGGNQLHDMFLDPAEQDLHPNWRDSTACLVANLRQSVGHDITDPRFIELTGELCLASPRFCQLWARHDVKAQYGAPITFNHPQVGEMTLNRERLGVGGAEHLKLVVYHPTPNTVDADKLALLASAAMPPRSEVKPASAHADQERPAPDLTTSPFGAARSDTFSP